MSFMHPLGLLGLIGIPIIILIYILRNKYNEQTVTSTYIWKLSDKFLKRKNPLSGLTGIIALILQILTVAAISLAIARPIFVLPGAANDYRFVLDASSSMNMENGRQTRFELAKDEIIDVIQSSKDGSSYTLICVSGDTVTAFEGVKKKQTAIELLQDVQAGDTSSSYNDVLRAAQGAFDGNTSAKIYLVTDKTYASHQNVELIEVGGTGQENYAVFNPTYSHMSGKLTVSAEVISYKSAGDVEVALLVDGKEITRKSVGVKSGEISPIEFTCSVSRFDSFEVKTTKKDAYGLDDNVIVYNTESDKTFNTLIVSETGFFLEAVIDALLDAEIKTVTPKQYATETGQYGLYIFDSYEPEVLPDGAVWLMNPDRSIDDSGFGVRGKVELGAATMIEKSKSTSTVVRKLLESVDGSGIHISRYVKYSGMYLNFHTLFSYNSNPLIFAGANGLGNRQVVFGFDLHESDFALSTDFVMLARNLLEYSFPDVVDETNYIAGEEAIINILANAENLKAISPSGREIFIDGEGATATLMLDEIGTYVVKMSISGVESNYRLYVGANPEESKPLIEEGEFLVAGEKGNDKIDGEFDALTLLFILLAVLFVADWGVYCYEKYQLR